MIRQGAVLRFAAWSHASDIRWTVLRLDRDTDTYHLQSTRGLNDCAVERCVLHSWLRRKAVTLVATSTPKPAAS